MAYILGTSGNDTLTGAAGSDELAGRALSCGKATKSTGYPKTSRVARPLV